jgi:hypothetical protein
MEAELQSFIDEAKDLNKTVKAETTAQIAKKSIRERTEKLGTRWFDLLPDLEQKGLYTQEILAPYSDAATRLIKLSSPNNSRASYLRSLGIMTRKFRDELILPLKSQRSVRSAASQFESFISALSDTTENDYFNEAVNCAKHNFLRAAAVLAWCATIDRIHRKVEQIGFAKFNVASADMATQQKGRYKRFNQTQSVTNMSEMREVFDTVVLWVIEGMGLIDSNQHTRLRSCFEMRNHSAHPGDAPITEYNLMSFFSDVQQIVLVNPKFELEPLSP